MPSKTNSQTSVADTQSPNPSTSGKEQESEVPSEGGSNQEKQEPQEEDPQGKQDAQEEEPLEALDFTMQDYDGNEVKFSDYIGTPIVLNFWASWCPPCRNEMPHFNKVSEEYPKDELLFLMIDMVDGVSETVDKGKKYVEGKGYTFDVFFDTEHDARIKYGIRSLPTTLFIDKNGHIVGAAEGGIDEKTLRYGVSLILDQ